VTNRSSDRALDEQRVARVVTAQFPELGGSAVRRLGSGWDHELFVLGDDERVFRFPKRAERVPWLLRELEIVGRVAPILGGVVPRFDYVGAPSEEFPYPFVATASFAASRPIVPSARARRLPRGSVRSSQSSMGSIRLVCLLRLWGGNTRTQ